MNEPFDSSYTKEIRRRQDISGYPQTILLMADKWTGYLSFTCIAVSVRVKEAKGLFSHVLSTSDARFYCPLRFHSDIEMMTLKNADKSNPATTMERIFFTRNVATNCPRIVRIMGIYSTNAIVGGEVEGVKARKNLKQSNAIRKRSIYL